MAVPQTQRLNLKERALKNDHTMNRLDYTLQLPQILSGYGSLRWPLTQSKFQTFPGGACPQTHYALYTCTWTTGCYMCHTNPHSICVCMPPPLLQSLDPPLNS